MEEYECYGESLSTHPDYLLMKRDYEEKKLLISLQKEENNNKFVSPVSENPFSRDIRENKKPADEKNILRNTMGSL